MQTLSGMQRDSFYKIYIKYFLIFLSLVVYESITSVYPYFSPLFGVAFYFILENIDKENSFLKIFLAFLYITVFEIDKGFIPLSFLIFFIIYYLFIYKKIDIFFNEKIYKIAIHITNGYMGYYITNSIIDYLLNYTIPSFDMKYAIYIVTDILLAVILF